MYRRVNLQPDPMKDYILETLSGVEYIGRWLAGATYEGWYVKTEDGGKVVPQSILKVIVFREPYKGAARHKYIPRKYLDRAFKEKFEVVHFIEPDILCYL